MIIGSVKCFLDAIASHYSYPPQPVGTYELCELVTYVLWQTPLLLSFHSSHLQKTMQKCTGSNALYV